MLSDKMEKALNAQLNAEAYSGYLYLAMAAWFDSKNLNGFAGWMKDQAREEFYHTAKFYGFINERGGRVLMKAIEEPQNEWESSLDVFEATLKHEQHVTSLINNLLKIAREEGDYASEIFLQWFVTEQVEEEAAADEVIQKMKMIGDHGHGLFMMDREMGQRGSSAEVQNALMGLGAAE